MCEKHRINSMEKSNMHIDFVRCTVFVRYFCCLFRKIGINIYAKRLISGYQGKPILKEEL